MSRLHPLVLTVLLSALPAFLAPPARAQAQLPEGFVLEPVGTDWFFPVGLCYLDPQRLLVAEKGGKLWYLEGGSDKSLVLDLQGEVLSNSDRGLLAIAADPQFDVNGWVYLLLVVDPDEDFSDDEKESFCRLVRYTLDYAANGDLLADPASRRVLIGSSWSTGIPSCHWSHAIGSLHFLSDGSLVLSAGDGASYSGMDLGGLHPPCFGPDAFPPGEDIGAFRSAVETSLAGKILRVDPATGQGLRDNPFYTGDPTDNASRVWALGLRNPFRFSLLPGTGPQEALVIADVGWNVWEELDLCWGGEHFGWPCYEGAEPSSYVAADPYGICSSLVGTFTPPLLAYHHYVQGQAGFVGNCVSGVVQYTGNSYPRAYQGALFFCDYAQGWLRAAQLSSDLTSVVSIDLVAEALGTPISLVTEPASGDLVFADFYGARIQRLRYLGPDLPPVAQASATPAWGPLPLTVDLSGAGSSDPEGEDLDYSWQLGDGATASGEQVQHVYTAATNATARLTVEDPGGLQGHAEVLISPGNTPPEVTAIDSPAAGALYTPGVSVILDASAVDAEDDPAGIPLAARWTATLVHGHHEHPATTVEGLTGFFLADGHGPGTYYKLSLRVEDSRGLSGREVVEIYDSTCEPEPHLVSLSDEHPRQGQTVRGVCHVEYPNTRAGLPGPDLEWDWGDGTVEVFPGVGHQEDQLVDHVYTQEGDYTVTLTARLGTFVDSVEVPVHVREARRAVAVFQPLVTNRWIPFSAQQAIAQSLATVLMAQGTEVMLYTYETQDELAAWMEGYLDDGIRDVVVVLDTVPAALYAGEDDDSLAERWLESGNGILWTGYQAFQEYVFADGLVSDAGAGTHGADEVLDSPTVGGLCGGAGDQIVLTVPLVSLPSLFPYYAQRAVRVDELGPEWTARRIYTTDLYGEADVVDLRHSSHGLYMQCWSTNAIGLPRAQTILELLATLEPIPEAGHVKR
jgi:glucose/arabinose dehydrogenase